MTNRFHPLLIKARNIAANVPEKYQHISFVPPDDVREAARMGIVLAKEEDIINTQRAERLSDGKQQSIGSVFLAHKIFSKANLTKTEHLLWGGEAGRLWIVTTVSALRDVDKSQGRTASFAEGTSAKRYEANVEDMLGCMYYMCKAAQSKSFSSRLDSDVNNVPESFAYASLKQYTKLDTDLAVKCIAYYFQNDAPKTSLSNDKLLGSLQNLGYVSTLNNCIRIFTRGK